ncbi:MAG TPA: NUDIX domain-containing protein [Actinomycetota bacterium]
MQNPDDAAPRTMRAAATVVVVREVVQGRLEFLVLKRSSTSRFLPGFMVFPGGVVEPQDTRLAEEWFGSAAEAARACALRELSEEVGLVVTGDGVIERPGGVPGGDGALPPPPLEALPEIARWIAPEFIPVRFDARFFAVRAGSGMDPHPDGVEAERAWWGSAQELLEAAEAGDVQLMWPTLKTLQVLAECSSVDEVLRLRIEQVPPPVRSS